MKNIKTTYLVAVCFSAVALITAGMFLSAISSVSGGRQTMLIIFTLLIETSLGATAWFAIKLAASIEDITQSFEADVLPRVTSRTNILLRPVISLIYRYFQGNNSYIDDLEERHQALQIKLKLLKREKNSSDAVIDSIRDSVLVVDEYGKLLTANEACAHLLSFDLKKSLRQSLSDILNENTEQLVDFLGICRKTKETASRKEIVLNKDDRERVFDCVASCVYDEKGEVSAVVAVLHDVTREKEVSQMKDDFVSHVSHELKTPLASILAYSELLADGEANDEKTRNEFYSVIQNQAKRLNRLIEDILNVSRIESGLVKVEKKPVSLELLIEEQLKMIKSYAEEKDITVTWGSGNIGSNSNIIVMGQIFADKDMISQVLVNLLSNAVKYTKNGGTIKVTSEINDKDEIARVTVIDSGVGIPEDEVEHVFDKFYRVSANNKQAKGTGLGLNLVKQIIEKVHGGKVFVSSEVGKGSTFGFDVPLATRDLIEQN